MGADILGFGEMKAEARKGAERLNGEFPVEKDESISEWDLEVVLPKDISVKLGEAEAGISCSLIFYGDGITAQCTLRDILDADEISVAVHGKLRALVAQLLHPWLNGAPLHLPEPLVIPADRARAWGVVLQAGGMVKISPAFSAHETVIERAGIRITCDVAVNKIFQRSFPWTKEMEGMEGRFELPEEHVFAPDILNNRDSVVFPAGRKVRAEVMAEKGVGMKHVRLTLIDAETGLQAICRPLKTLQDTNRFSTVQLESFHALHTILRNPDVETTLSGDVGIDPSIAPLMLVRIPAGNVVQVCRHEDTRRTIVECGGIRCDTGVIANKPFVRLPHAEISDITAETADASEESL